EAPAAPAAKEPKAQILGADSRITWSEPRNWLSFAYEAAGRDERDAVEFWPKALGTLKAQALEDVRALSEARRVFEPVAGTPDPDVQGPTMSGTSLLSEANTRQGSEEALIRHEEACGEFKLANDDVGLVRAFAAKASAFERTDPGRAAEAWTRADALLDR